MTLINRLKDICPATESLSEKIAYSSDASTIEGKPLAVCWPENLDQIQRLVRFSIREKLSLVPRGGGTSLVGGAVPNYENSLVIDMSRMNKIKKLLINDKIVTLETGVYLDHLNEALSSYNLEFPIKPGSHSACSIGGMISTNAGGLLSKKYGKIQDWVEEITLIDGSGKLFTFSGQDAKRVVGSEGCCGIITEAKLKLEEIKEYSSDIFEFDNLQDMFAKLKELKEDDSVIALEYINSHAYKLLEKTPKEILLVKYDSDKGKFSPAEAEKLWKIRENLYSLLMNLGYIKIEDPYFEKDIEKFVDWINKQEIPCYGHIAYGILHPHFKSEKEIEKMNQIVKELKGNIAGEHGIGILKKSYAPLEISVKIKELKSLYDPYDIMNKGKVI